MSRSCKSCDGFGMRGSAECRDCNGTGLPRSGQSRRMSLHEAVTSTAIGFAVSIALTAVVLPAFGHDVTLVQNFWITSIFTVASIVRGYCVRRLFEGWRR